jgi:integrase
MGITVKPFPIPCPRLDLPIFTAPAIFTADEVERILENIDNNNPSGKRNYAIILTVAKLGLRS